MWSTSKGFIALSPKLIGLILAISVFGCILIYVKILQLRLEACEQFKIRVEQMGKEAEQRAKEKAKKDKILKERADAKYLQVLRERNSALERLRVSASGSSLPAASASAKEPNRICFARDQLDDALRKFTVGTAAIAGEGDDYFSRLENAHEWAAANTPAAENPQPR